MVDPPQGERPKCYSRLDMIPGDVSSRKYWKSVRHPAVKTRKIRGPQKKRKSRFDKLKIGGLSNGLSHRVKQR